MSIALGGASFSSKPVPEIDLVRHWPSDFGGSFQKMVDYCNAQNRMLTIIVDDNIDVPEGFWSIGTPNASVTFDCQSQPRTWRFLANATMSTYGIALMKSFVNIVNSGENCGFICDQATAMTIDGGQITTDLNTNESVNYPLFQVNVPLVVYFYNAYGSSNYTGGGPPLFQDDNDLVLRIGTGGGIQDQAIQGSGNLLFEFLNTNDFWRLSTQQGPPTSTFNATDQVTNVDVDFDIWPSHKQLFVDSAGCHKLHLPRFSYDGQTITITDRQVTTDFASSPVDLDSFGASTTIQDPNSPTNFMPLVPLKDKGMSITFVYDSGADKWRITSIYR